MINTACAAVLACAVYFISNTVEAAEIKILCASGMREVISELQAYKSCGLSGSR